MIILEVELNKDAVCHRFYSTCSPYLAKWALEGFEGFKTGGQAIHITKYTYELLRMVKEETALQVVTERPTEIGT